MSTHTPGCHPFFEIVDVPPPDLFSFFCRNDPLASNRREREIEREKERERALNNNGCEWHGVRVGVAGMLVVRPLRRARVKATWARFLDL